MARPGDTLRIVAQRRGAGYPPVGPHNRDRTIGDHMRAYRDVKAARVGDPFLYTHFNARADNWPSALLASSIRKHLIGLKALITALNCANARFYPY